MAEVLTQDQIIAKELIDLTTELCNSYTELDDDQYGLFIDRPKTDGDYDKVIVNLIYDDEEKFIKRNGLRRTSYSIHQHNTSIDNVTYWKYAYEHDPYPSSVQDSKVIRDELFALLLSDFRQGLVTKELLIQIFHSTFAFSSSYKEHRERAIELLLCLEPEGNRVLTDQEVIDRRTIHKLTH